MEGSASRRGEPDGITDHFGDGSGETEAGEGWLVRRDRENLGGIAESIDVRTAVGEPVELVIRSRDGHERGTVAVPTDDRSIDRSERPHGKRVGAQGIGDGIGEAVGSGVSLRRGVSERSIRLHRDRSVCGIRVGHYLEGDWVVDEQARRCRDGEWLIRGRAVAAVRRHRRKREDPYERGDSLLVGIVGLADFRNRIGGVGDHGTHGNSP